LAPANQFVQVQLWGRLFKTKSFLNWSMNEKVATHFVDINLMIDINGSRVLSQYGNCYWFHINLSEGDQCHVMRYFQYLLLGLLVFSHIQSW